MKELEKDFGVLYFVDPNPHFQRMADISIQSLKSFHPDWPVEVMECGAFPVPLWKKIYRALSFWKWSERSNRARQDWRVLFAKANGQINSPFRHTLYLDADTIVMRPLDQVLERARQYDVVANSLGWKHYNGFESWQPAQFPMIMSGIVFYNEIFKEIYQTYVDRLAVGAGKHFAGDQYIFSMTCHMEAEKLRILLEPYLQIDTMNLEEHLCRNDYPRRGNILDLTYEGLKKFHIFHYNGPHKREYLGQIKDVWGLPSDE
jgi:hypothetical protein